MRLSDLLKTLDPVKFYGIEAKQSDHVSDIGNTERLDPNAGFFLSERGKNEFFIITGGGTTPERPENKMHIDSSIKILEIVKSGK